MTHMNEASFIWKLFGLAFGCQQDHCLGKTLNWRIIIFSTHNLTTCVAISDWPFYLMKKIYTLHSTICSADTQGVTSKNFPPIPVSHP